MSSNLDRDVFYICYNGIDEALVQSQVLNYLRGLARLGVRFQLLTFEKHAPSDAAGKREALARDGIDWFWESYSGRSGSLGTAKDILIGAWHVVKLQRAAQLDFVHCRSFIPALMAWLASWLAGARYVYDIRGFWVHEKRYKGRIRNSQQFRLASWLDQRLYRDAAAIVSLTHAAARVVEGDFAQSPPDKRPHIVVIPTCADLAPYAVARGPLNRDAPLFVYSGSLGAGYLCDELFRFFIRARRHWRRARLLVLSLTESGPIMQSALRCGLTKVDFVLKSVRAEEVPAELMQCDVGLSFIKPDFSNIASCPTKLAEYLAAGLPVVANAGIGDVDQILSGDRVGVVLPSFADSTLDSGLEALGTLLRDPDVAQRARSIAAQTFSLEYGIAEYASLYARLGRAN